MAAPQCSGRAGSPCFVSMREWCGSTHELPCCRLTFLAGRVRREHTGAHHHLGLLAGCQCRVSAAALPLCAAVLWLPSCEPNPLAPCFFPAHVLAQQAHPPRAEHSEPSEPCPAAAAAASVAHAEASRQRGRQVHAWRPRPRVGGCQHGEGGLGGAVVGRSAALPCALGRWRRYQAFLAAEFGRSRSGAVGQRWPANGFDGRSRRVRSGKAQQANVCGQVNGWGVGSSQPSLTPKRPRLREQRGRIAHKPPPASAMAATAAWRCIYSRCVWAAAVDLRAAKRGGVALPVDWVVWDTRGAAEEG